MTSTSLDAVDLATTDPATTDSGSRDRFPLAALLVFALLGFLLISTETMPAGVLPQIAAGLGTSPGVAGQLVSVYALGTVLATVPAIVLTRRFRRKPLLIVVVACFLLANAATALSPHIALSLASRFVAGALSGTLWGMLAGYTLKITTPDRAGRALSIMSLGAPVGMAFGTPLGTWLGVTFGWRWSFGGLGILSAAGLVAALLLVPDAPGHQAAARSRPTRVLRIPGVAAILLVIVAWMLGNSTTYTYIAPFLEAARSTVRIEVLLVVFGLASIGGLALTALLVDRRPRTLVVSSLAGFAAAGVLLVLGHQHPFAVYAAIVVLGPRVRRCVAAAAARAQQDQRGARRRGELVPARRVQRRDLRRGGPRRRRAQHRRRTRAAPDDHLLRARRPPGRAPLPELHLPPRPLTVARRLARTRHSLTVRNHTIMTSHQKIVAGSRPSRSSPRSCSRSRQPCSSPVRRRATPTHAAPSSSARGG